MVSSMSSDLSSSDEDRLTRYKRQGRIGKIDAESRENSDSTLKDFDSSDATTSDNDSSLSSDSTLKPPATKSNTSDSGSSCKNNKEKTTPEKKVESLSSELSDVIDDNGSGSSGVVEEVEGQQDLSPKDKQGTLLEELTDGRDGNMSESSEREIIEDIVVQSDHANKSSSTTDNEELLRQFRQQHATRRARPRSAKIRHKLEPETQNVVKVLSQSDTDSDEENSKELKTKRQNRPKQKSEKKSKTKSVTSSSGTSQSSEYLSSDKEIKEKDDKRIYGPRSVSRSRSVSSSPESKSSSSKSSLVSTDKAAIKKEDQVVDKPQSISSSTDSSTKLRRQKERNTLKPHHRDLKQAKIEELINKIQLINQSSRRRYSEDYSTASSSNISSYQRAKFLSEGTQTKEEGEESHEEDNKSLSSSEATFGALTLREILEIEEQDIKHNYLHYYLQNYLSNEVQRHGLYFQKYERSRPPKTGTIARAPPPRRRNTSNTPFSWIYLNGKLVKVYDSMGAVVEKESRHNRYKQRPKSAHPSLTRKVSPRLALADQSKQKKNKRSSSSKSRSRSRDSGSRSSHRSEKALTSKYSVNLSRKKEKEKSSANKRIGKTPSRDSSRVDSKRGRDKKKERKNTKSRTSSLGRSASRSMSRHSSASSSIERRGRRTRPKSAMEKFKDIMSRSRSKSSGKSRSRSRSISRDKTRPKSRSRSNSKSSERSLQKKRKKFKNIMIGSRSKSSGKSRSRSRSISSDKINSKSRSRSNSKSSDRVSQKKKPTQPTRPKTALARKIRESLSRSRSRSKSAESTSSSKEKRKSNQKKEHSRRMDSISSSDDEMSSRSSSRHSKKEKWYKRLANFAHWEEKREAKRRSKNIKVYVEEVDGNPPKGILHRRKNRKNNKSVRISSTGDIRKHIRNYPEQNPIFSVENMDGGYLLPQNYISTILHKKGQKGKAETMPTRIILVPAPVLGPSRYNRISRPPRSRSTTQKPTRKAKKAPKSKYEDDSSSDDNGSSHSSVAERRSGNFPRVRPGSGRIKCSWNKSENQPRPPTEKFTDHQLKNTDNPMVLDWLKQKNEETRRQRRDDYKKRRKRTDYLIDEQNFKDEKRAKAIEEYQTWKKKKDKEILLRRRNETLEANSATAHKKHSHAETFAALRSSSTSNTKANGVKPRPKSASHLKVSFGERDKGNRPRSASPRSTMKQNSGGKSKSTNFMKSALVMDAEENKEDKDMIASRQNYDKWVRSKPKKTRPPANHNPLDNELLSDLAKRRIKSILDSKKRVDSGMSRPRTAPPKIKSKDTGNEKRPKHKWRLRNDDVIPPKNSASKKERNDSNNIERPKFSFNRKTNSKTTNYDRNPVIRRSKQENALPA